MDQKILKRAYGPSTFLCSQPVQSSPHPSHFLNIHFHKFLSMPRFYRCFFQASLLEPYVHVSSLLYVPHYRTIAFFGHLKHIWCGSTDHKARHYVAYSTPVTSSLVDPGISLSTPCSSSVQVQASHLYKTTEKITQLCILMFMLHSSKWEDGRFWTKWWGLHSLNLVCS
jgi:hypothetical protein